MKKQWVLILCILLVCGLGFIGCDTGTGTTSGGNTDPKTIVIEGISNDYKAEGSIRVFSDLNDIVNNVPVNAGIGYGAITGGKLSIELTVPNNNTYEDPSNKWAGNGNYYIYFIPQVNNEYSTMNGRIYVGNDQQPQKYNINEAVITIPYSAFKQYNVWK